MELTKYILQIKEIIGTLQECINNPVITDFYYKNEVDRIVHITSSGCKVLLDYITNLQQENERLKKQVSEYQDEIFGRDNSWYDMQD